MAEIIDAHTQRSAGAPRRPDNLWLRRLGIVVGILLIAAGFYGYQQMSAAKAAPETKEKPVRLRTVQTAPVRNTTIPATLDVQGQLQAFDKVQLYTEVGGMFERSAKSFKVGSYYPKGSVIAEIDDQEARLSLLSAKANLQNAITAIMPDLKIDYPQSFPQWEAYLRSFDVNRAVQPFPAAVNEQEKMFVASRNLFTQYYTIQSQEERLSKYTVYAPFSGELTIANTNVGAVVSPGQPLGTLMNTSSYELAATVSLADLAYLQPGSTVQLYSEDVAGNWKGKVRRISNQVDPGTQTVTVFVGVSGRNLREGMYLKGEAEGSAIDNATIIDRDMLVDQGSVYVVRDSLLALEPVEVVKYTDDRVIIRGLSDGTPLLADKVPGAFEGMKVKVDRGGSASASGMEASL